MFLELTVIFIFCFLFKSKKLLYMWQEMYANDETGRNAAVINISVHQKVLKAIIALLTYFDIG